VPSKGKVSRNAENDEWKCEQRLLGLVLTSPQEQLAIHFARRIDNRRRRIIGRGNAERERVGDDIAGVTGGYSDHIEIFTSAY
tara:strand:+ start:1276 stop:1524 length:249 start_codon:yes stop_codon:yes gene_type:complete